MEQGRRLQREHGGARGCEWPPALRGRRAVLARPNRAHPIAARLNPSRPDSPPAPSGCGLNNQAPRKPHQWASAPPQRSPPRAGCLGQPLHKATEDAETPQRPSASAFQRKRKSSSAPPHAPLPPHKAWQQVRRPGVGAAGAPARGQPCPPLADAVKRALSCRPHRPSQGPLGMSATAAPVAAPQAGAAGDAGWAISPGLALAFVLVAFAAAACMLLLAVCIWGRRKQARRGAQGALELSLRRGRLPARGRPGAAGPAGRRLPRQPPRRRPPCLMLSSCVHCRSPPAARPRGVASQGRPAAAAHTCSASRGGYAGRGRAVRHARGPGGGAAGRRGRRQQRHQCRRRWPHRAAAHDKRWHP